MVKKSGCERCKNEDEVIETLKAVQTIYRSKHSGLCRMFSQGDDCRCFLCHIDNLIKLRIQLLDYMKEKADV